MLSALDKSVGWRPTLRLGALALLKGAATVLAVVWAYRGLELLLRHYFNAHLPAIMYSAVLVATFGGAYSAALRSYRSGLKTLVCQKKDTAGNDRSATSWPPEPRDTRAAQKLSRAQEFAIGQIAKRLARWLICGLVLLVLSVVKPPL